MKKNDIVINSLLVLVIINLLLLVFQVNMLPIHYKIIPFIVNVSFAILLGIYIFLMYKSLMTFIERRKLVIIISTILLIILLTLNSFIYLFNNKINTIFNNEEIYSSVIIVKSDSQIQNIDDLYNKKIGASSNHNDYENYKIAYDYLEKENKVENNNFFSYEDYILAINDLLKGNIDVLIISGNYLNIYDEFFDNLSVEVRPIIKKLEYSLKRKQKSKVDYEKPFNLLVIGADGEGGATYDADVLILLNINPNTKKITMIDVVRDTYALNLGNNKMDKITHSGWYGTLNVADTVANLFDTKIDYYIKFNFNSVVDFINLMGGIDFDVPYDYIVKSNGRNYTISKGVHHLNGIETLWLARTRKAPNSSLFTRGYRQMEIIEEVSKQAKSSFVLNNFFSIFDILSNNITTNIEKNDLYCLLQKYMFNKESFEFKKEQLDGIDSTYYHESMKDTLYTYKYDENSLNRLKKIVNGK